MAATVKASCARHRRRSPLARCATCDAPMCEGCIVPTPVGFKCPGCAGSTRRRPRAARSAAGLVPLAATAPPVPRSGSGFDKRWLSLAGIVAVLAALTLVVAQRGTDHRVVGDDRSVVGLDRSVEFAGAGNLPISGSLRLPTSTDGAKVPGVLLLGGFGNTDRDGVPAGGGFTDAVYRDLSDSLEKAGVASLRYDKRGTGDSLVPPDRSIGLADMVDDARAALGYLAARPEIDRGSLAVLGHELGGLVGMRLADDERMSRLVLVSTPGRPMVDVVAEDVARTVGQDKADAVRVVVAQLQATGSMPPLDTQPAEIRNFFLADPAYLSALFRVDPVADAAKVDVPVLLVRAERAPGVTAADLEQLDRALGARDESIVDPEAGRTLDLPQDAAAAADDHDDHSHTETEVGPSVPRDQQLVDRITAWLATGLGARRPA